MVGGIDLIDLGIGLIGEVENREEWWFMVDAIAEFIVLWQNIEPSIVEYMLVSTEVVD